MLSDSIMVDPFTAAAIVRARLLDILKKAAPDEGCFVPLEDMALNETALSALIVLLDREGVGSHVKEGLFYFHRKAPAN